MEAFSILNPLISNGILQNIWSEKEFHPAFYSINLADFARNFLLLRNHSQKFSVLRNASKTQRFTIKIHKARTSCVCEFVSSRIYYLSLEKYGERQQFKQMR